MLTAIATIAIFLVMISLHEFGHFSMAKLSGITVLEFAIGMGPALFKKEKNGTLYSIRALPIGGYCKMEGEDTESDDAGAFCNQKLWKRFLVVVAGAMLNIILGFMLFVIIALNCAPFATNEISSVDERSNMAAAGVMAGDKIVRMNGRKISFYKDITLYKDELDPTKEIELEVKRGRDRLKFSFMMTAETGNITYNRDGYVRTSEMNGISKTVSGKYAEGAVIPEEKYGTSVDFSQYMIGFSPVQEGLGVKSVLREAYCNTKFVVKLVYKTLWDMISGKTGIEQVSGPVGVVGAVNDAVHSSAGIWAVLTTAALLTINLGIFNLLPIPALDGGRILFMLIELVRGRPVSAEREGLVHAIGLLLLLAFAALISAKDIIQLFR